jgi:hypothetical protein
MHLGVLNTIPCQRQLHHVTLALKGHDLFVQNIFISNLDVLDIPGELLGKITLLIRSLDLQCFSGKTI